MSLPDPLPAGAVWGPPWTLQPLVVSPPVSVPSARAVREGGALTVTRPGRLARSVPGALDILNNLPARGVRFAPGGPACDWNDPFARMFLQILAVIAGFEASLIRRRTREGTAIARQNGRLRGRQPGLSSARDREIRRMHDSGGYNAAEIAALSGVGWPTVYRSLNRTSALSPRPAGTRPAPGTAQSGRLLPPRRETRSGSPDRRLFRDSSVDPQRSAQEIVRAAACPYRSHLPWDSPRLAITKLTP